jgi:hypothetical protein
MLSQQTLGYLYSVLQRITTESPEAAMAHAQAFMEVRAAMQQTAPPERGPVE